MLHTLELLIAAVFRSLLVGSIFGGPKVVDVSKVAKSSGVMLWGVRALNAVLGL